MSKETGGPAFPVEKAIAADGSYYFPAEHTGMTLRDYFAAKALTGLMTLVANNMHECKGDDDLARMAYSIADAMIAERSK